MFEALIKSITPDKTNKFRNFPKPLFMNYFDIDLL